MEVGRVAGITMLACLTGACLETPGAGHADGGGPPAPGTTDWQLALGDSAPVVAAADGDVIVAAGFAGTVELGEPIEGTGGGVDLLVTRLSAGGEPTFVHTYGGQADEWASAIAVSPVSREIGVLGLYNNGSADLGGAVLPSPVTGYNLFLARYDQAGLHRWSLAGSSDEGVGVPFVLSMGGSSELALGGDFETSLTLAGTPIGQPGTGRDLFYSRVSDDGTLLTLIAAGGGGADSASGAVFDGLGSVYLFGTQTGPFALGTFSPDSDSDGGMFVCRIDPPGGEVIWGFDSIGATVGGLRGAVTPDGSLALAGWFEGTFGFELPEQPVLTSLGGTDVFMALIRPDGTVEHVDQFGGEGDDEPRGVAVGPGGEIALTATFHGDARLGETGETLHSKGGSDIAVASFSADGELRWARSFGGAEDDGGVSVAVDQDGAVAIGVLYRGVVDFGGQEPLDSGGETRAAVIRFH